MFFYHQCRTQSNVWVALTVLTGFLILFWQLFDLHQAVHGHQAQREHGPVPAEGPAAAAALRRGRQALATAAGPHPPLRHHPAGTAAKTHPALQSDQGTWVQKVIVEMQYCKWTTVKSEEQLSTFKYLSDVQHLHETQKHSLSYEQNQLLEWVSFVLYSNTGLK